MREKLIELLSYFGDGYIAKNRHIVCDTKICEIADHLIANGVVPVVRCKDCKHFVPFVDPYNKAGMCNRKMLGLIPEDGFCSYGERKGDGNV